MTRFKQSKKESFLTANEILQSHVDKPFEAPHDKTKTRRPLVLYRSHMLKSAVTEEKNLNRALG